MKKKRTAHPIALKGLQVVLYTLRSLQTKATRKYKQHKAKEYLYTISALSAAINATTEQIQATREAINTTNTQQNNPRAE